jgi:hypothetical protein
MRFIEIAIGTTISADQIESIVANKDGKSCTVKTCWNTYQSTFPYQVLISLLQKKEEPEKKEALNILKTLGSYAG